MGVAAFSDRIESFLTVQVRQTESDYWQVGGLVMDQLKRRSLLIMMTHILDADAGTGLIHNMARAAWP